MKRKITYLIIISSMLFMCHEMYAQPSWAQVGNFPGTGRYASAFFTIGNNGYMGTGYDGGVKNDFWKYDKLTDSWTQIANFAGGNRFHAGCFAIGNKGYVGIGSAAYPVYSWPQDFWEYDPVANSWTQRANFPAQGRYTVASFSIGSKGYMGTGWRSGIYYNDFYEYDQATDTWTAKANFPALARQATATFVINGKGYVGAGANGSNVLQDFWQYNPVLDSWSQRANIPGPNRNAACAFAVYNFGYVGLGSSTYPSITFLNDFWQYDDANNSWAPFLNFPGSPRYSVFTFSFGCDAYVGTGEYGPNSPRTFENDVWKFLCESVGTSVSDINNALHNYTALPNPFANTLIINSTNHEDFNLNVYDVAGRLVYSGINFNGSASLGVELGAGVYHVEIITAGKKELIKVVKL
jgi:N-acetylneuraminic acid mutarotase